MQQETQPERMMRYLTIVFICTLLFWHLVALPCVAAGSGTELAEFFAPLSAIVVMPVGSEVLIDKGAEDGIVQGDILTVVNGEKDLRHPQTGQLLDTLGDYGSHLVVTRVKANLSYCKVLGSDQKLTEGTRVRRYENVPVIFEDTSGTGFQVFQSLQRKLPHLLWKDYLLEKSGVFPERTLGLFIHYAPDNVVVFNQDRKILFVSQISTVGESVRGEDSSRSAVAASIPLTSAPEQTQAVTVPTDQSSLVGINWAVKRIDLPLIGEIEALRVSDLNRDGMVDILLGTGGELVVGRLEGQQLVETTHYTTQDWDQVIDISVLDLDDDGRNEVIVSALEGNRSLARVFRLTDNRLTVVADVPMLLGTFMDEGGRPILIGVEGRAYLNHRPQFYSIKLIDGRVMKTPFSLDGVQQPYGVTAFLDEDGTRWLSSLSAQDRIRVTDMQGQVFWESADTYGGSHKNVKIPLSGARNADAFDKYFFRSRVNKSPRETVLVAQHDGPGALRNSPSYTNGRLVELSWNGASLDEVNRSRSLGGMIADFDQFDLEGDGVQDVIAAVVYRKKGLFRKPVSGLVVLSSR